MKRLNKSDIPCRKLFDVKTMPQKQEYVAVSASGELLYVTEELAGMVMTYGQKTLFLLDRSEFLAHVERAERRGKLRKAIEHNWTSMDEIERLCR